MSYLAGDAGRPLAELTDSSTALLVFDDSSTDPEQPASITNGEAPLAFLLSAPDLPDQARPGRDSQIAELVAFSDSSLALAATLWTMPSDLQAPTGDDARSAALAADSKSSAPSIPSWTAYWIGLDQAVQRSALDLREELAGADRPAISPGRRTEWQGPILPAGTARPLERDESAPTRKATPSTSRQSPSEPHIPARDAHAAQAPESSSTEPSSLAIAVIPAISALSLFGAAGSGAAPGVAPAALAQDDPPGAIERPAAHDVIGADRRFAEARQRRATSYSLGCKPQECPQANAYSPPEPANAGNIVLGFTPQVVPCRAYSGAGNTACARIRPGVHTPGHAMLPASGGLLGHH